jgi:hypothetical protein
VLRGKVRAAVDPTMADIAVAVYDLDQIAMRLTAGADYAGLTALLAVDLTSARIAAGAQRGTSSGDQHGPALGDDGLPGGPPVDVAVGGARLRLRRKVGGAAP